MGDMCQVPIIIVLCFTFLFIYLSYAFFAGLGVFAIAFVVNTIIGSYIKTSQIKVMKAKDQRMTETTQSLNNIKFLKLYSWQDLFEGRIQEKRAIELAAIAKIMYATCLLIAFIYFFPNLMPAASFTTYIGFNMQPYLDLPTATTCLIFFGMVSQPMFRVPMAVTSFLQVMVSMKRV